MPRIEKWLKLDNVTSAPVKKNVVSLATEPRYSLTALDSFYFIIIYFFICSKDFIRYESKLQTETTTNTPNISNIKIPSERIYMSVIQ